jgi:hypothetical protein
MDNDHHMRNSRGRHTGACRAHRCATARIGLDYRIEPPDALGPPITFSFITDLPADVLRQIHAIPDTMIM